jgi:hypothetical protein
MGESDAKFENEQNNQDQEGGIMLRQSRCAGMNCHLRRLARELRRQ